MTTMTEEQTLDELYLRHHDALRRFLTRMLRSEETAAEVAQDTYLRLVRYASRRPMDDPKAYLFQVAANAARDRLTRERVEERVVQHGPISELVPCPLPDAEAVRLGRERMCMLLDAINELPPRCREVLLLSRFDDLSNGAIAERLGISRSMVEKHLIKAMVHCRHRLDDRRK